MLHFQDNEEYQLKKWEIAILKEFMLDWNRHLNEVIPFNNEDFLNLIRFLTLNILVFLMVSLE